MFSRAISTSDRQFRDNMAEGGVQWQRMMLDLFTGIRQKDMDLDEQSLKKLKDRMRQLEESLTRRGSMEVFSKPYKRKDQSGVTY